MPTKFVTNPRRPVEKTARIPTRRTTTRRRNPSSIEELYAAYKTADDAAEEAMVEYSVAREAAIEADANEKDAFLVGSASQRARLADASRAARSHEHVARYDYNRAEKARDAAYNAYIAAAKKGNPARRPAARRKNPASSRPSVKMLSQVVTPAEAKELRSMMEYTGPAGVLRAASRMMDGFDVEYIRSRNDTMRTPDGLDFVNMGDTYDLTLIYDHGKGKYVVSSWGDIVEADMRLPASRRRFD